MGILLLEAIVALSILTYSTITIYSLYSTLRNSMDPNDYKGKFYKERPSGRKIVVEIVTNGQNPEVVEDIIRTLKGYTAKFETWVLKEAYDQNEYSASQIVVPASYRTKNGSLKKTRALQYGIEFFHRRGYGPETYIIHLDDDSVVKESYIRYVERMKAAAGQGCIKLRGYGKHLFSTLADMMRVTTCDLYCTHFNAKGRPKYVHGEGLVIRSDVEYLVGWDHGEHLGADDLIMGVSIPHNGYSFTHIPDNIYIASPLSVKDFYRQRRRWIYGVMMSAKLIKERDLNAYRFIIYRYIVGWIGLVGWVLWIPAILLIGWKLPALIIFLGLFNLVVSLFLYERGVLMTDKKYALLMLVLFVPVAFYESGTFLYTVFCPPKKGTFDVIRKARI